MEQVAKSEVRLHRRYGPCIERSSEWFISVSQLGTLLPHPLYTAGRARLESPRDYEFTFEALEEWRQFVVDRWGDVRAIELNVGSNDESLHLTADLELGEVSLNLKAPTSGTLDSRVSEAESALALPMLSGDEAAHGLRRRYFVNSAITPAWIGNVLKTIEKQSGPRPHVDARLRLAQSGTPERAFGDLPSWHAEIVDAWPDLAHFYLWLSGRGYRVELRYDLRRQLLDVETRGPTYDAALSLGATLVRGLDVEEAPEDPYKYRRFARSFKIIKWKGNAALGEAIRAAVDKSFPKPRVLVASYVTQGGSAQDLEASETIEAFLARLSGSSVQYDGAHIHIEGPRGKALSINVDRSKEELVIRSSLDRRDFNHLVAEFESRIDLKLIRDTSSDTEKAANAGSGDALLPKVVLLALGLILSVEFVKEAIPRYGLEIVFPREQVDGTATLQSDTIRVYWVVKKTRWWDTKEQSDVPAMVQLLNSHGTVVLERHDQQSGSAFVVSPGDYEVAVQIPRIRKSARVALRIVAPNLTAPSHRGAPQTRP